jgi:hypothetical protein
MMDLGSRFSLLVVGALAVATFMTTSAFAGGRRLRPPPDVTLHPDRGMTFSRFSKTSHDQRVFKAMNQATRLPVMDPAVDPYNLGLRSNVYDPQSGQIRGSLSDAYQSIRRAQEASRRAARGTRQATDGRRRASSRDASAAND